MTRTFRLVLAMVLPTLLALPLIFYPMMTAQAGFWDNINPVRIVTNLVGQGISAIAGPTINHAAESFTAAGMTLEAQLNADMTQRVKQFDDIVIKNISKTDEVITKQIFELDRILTEKTGQIDIIGTRQISNLEASLLRVTAFGSLMITLSILCVILVTFMSYRLKSRTWSRWDFLTLAGATAAFAIVLLSSSMLRPRPEERVTALSAALLNSYKDSARLGAIDNARYYAAQLSILSEEPAALFLKDLAELQRDLLKRPALFKTMKGGLELYTRMKLLDATWASIRGRVGPGWSFLKYEVPATDAMVQWQVSTFNSEEVTATCSALESIRAFANSSNDGSTSAGSSFGIAQAQDASPYVWLAIGYAEWAAVRHLTDKCGDVAVGKTLSDLALILAAFSDPKTVPNPVVEHVVRFNRAAVAFYKSASQSYVSMILDDAQFRNTLPVNKPEFMKRRGEASAQIISAWDDFIGEISKHPIVQSNDIVYAAAGLPAALLMRAVSLGPNNSDGNIHPGFSIAMCMDLVNKLKDPAVKAQTAGNKLTGLLLMLDPSLHPLFCQDQIMIDAKLVLYETSLAEAYAPGANTTIAKQKLADAKGQANERYSPQDVGSSVIACVRSANLKENNFSDRGCTTEEKAQFGVRALGEWLRDGPTGEDLRRFAAVR